MMYFSPFQKRCLQTIAILVFIGGLMAFIFTIIPYTPYKVEEYQSIPGVACPGQPVRTEVERVIDPPLPAPLAAIEDINVTTYWENVDTGVATRTEAIRIPVSPDDYGTRTMPSPLIRSTPTIPGNWRIVSDYRIDGRVGFVPRPYIFRFKSDKLLTILDEDSEACSDRIASIPEG